MVAKRDRALGEELLTKLREKNEREATDAKNKPVLDEKTK
jgi:hypothetical protein